MRARYTVGLQHVQELFQLEARHDDDGRSFEETRVHDDVHAVDVEERQDGDQRVLFRDAINFFKLAQVSDHVVMRQHHTLRHAGRAARIRQRNDVFARVDFNLRHNSFALKQRGKRRCARRFTEDENLLHLGALTCLQCFVNQLRNGQQIFHTRIIKLMSQFVCGVKRIDRRDDAAERGDRVKGNGVLQ